MNDNTRNQSAHDALEILKMSALEALYKRSSSTYFVEPHVQQLEILRDLGIPEITTRYLRERRSLIHGILLHLEADNKYAEYLGNGRWRITKEGISAIETERT